MQKTAGGVDWRLFEREPTQFLHPVEPYDELSLSKINGIRRGLEIFEPARLGSPRALGTGGALVGLRGAVAAVSKRLAMGRGQC